MGADSHAGSLRQRIVVIDDHEASRHLVRDTLAFAGYEVCTAKDAEAGLALCRTVGCALVILDIRLPGAMDGYQAVASLRSDPLLRTTRAIALTAQAFPGDRATALAAGFDEYLAKPVRLPELREAVDRLLGLGRG